MTLFSRDKHRRCQEAITVFVILMAAMNISEEWLKAQGLWSASIIGSLFTNLIWIWVE